MVFQRSFVFSPPSANFNSRSLPISQCSDVELYGRMLKFAEGAKKWLDETPSHTKITEWATTNLFASQYNDRKLVCIDCWNAGYMDKR
jgi:hypothetical protein